MKDIRDEISVLSIAKYIFRLRDKDGKVIAYKLKLVKLKSTHSSSR